MRNRFVKQKRSYSRFRELVLPVVLFAVVCGLFFRGVASVGATTDAERLNAVQEAVTRAAVQCYALEGEYPPSLSYLEEHYGLSLDGRYIVRYEIFGSNMMPSITVLPVQEGGVEG